MGTLSIPGIQASPHPPARPPLLLTSVKVALVGILIAVFYRKVASYLVYDWWTHPEHSHGLLVPPLTLYFAWLQRKAILATPAVASPMGLGVIAAACLMCLAGNVGADLFLQRLSMVVLLAGLIWTFWGRRRLRRTAFPLVLLATMVPLPMLVHSSLSGPLQLFASDTATSLARLLGVTVFRDGNVIHLATLSLGVEEACSGLNSLSALVIGALLIGRLQCTRHSLRAALLFLSVPLAIAINVLRITGTAIMADTYQDVAEGFYHSFTGWLVFIVGVLGLFGIAGALNLLFDRRRAPL